MASHEYARCGCGTVFKLPHAKSRQKQCEECCKRASASIADTHWQLKLLSDAERTVGGSSVMDLADYRFVPDDKSPTTKTAFESAFESLFSEGDLHIGADYDDDCSVIRSTFEKLVREADTYWQLKIIAAIDAQIEEAVPWLPQDALKEWCKEPALSDEMEYVGSAPLPVRYSVVDGNVQQHTLPTQSNRWWCAVDHCGRPVEYTHAASASAAKAAFDRSGAEYIHIIRSVSR